MTVRASLFTRATSGHAGLSALISVRFYPELLPKNVTLPAIAYTLVTDPPNMYSDHDGVPDRWLSRYQLDGYAATPDLADALMIQMFLAFHGWQLIPDVGYSMVKNRFTTDGIPFAAHRVVMDIEIDHKL